MELDNILEGNKLIAEFMGAKKAIPVGKKGGYTGVPITHHGVTTTWTCFYSDLKYHTSWDWLMPVVEKISKLPLLNHDNTPCTDPIDTCYPITFNMPDREQGGNVLFRFKGFSLHSEKTLIGAAWKAVVEVAEYHLNQNKQS